MNNLFALTSTLVLIALKEKFSVCIKDLELNFGLKLTGWENRCGLPHSITPAVSKSKQQNVKAMSVL